MEQSTLNRIKLEMQSFKGLIITNLIGGAFAITFSMAYGMPNIIPLLVEGSFDIMQLPYLGLIVLGFVVAIRWITKSAELMGEHDEIMDELEGIKPDDDEAITQVIIESLAFYRENQANIKQLGIVGRIVGGFLILTAIPQIQAIVGGVYPLGQWMVIGQILGLLGSLGVGVAGLYVPTLINKFVSKWDARLSSAGAAEKKLDRILQG